jgi:predicted methyltransferase
MDDRTAPDALDLRATSTGQALAAADWLDTHFAACRPEYEAQLRAAGIRPGRRVLDAGCGAGSFLPRLGDLVGPAGHLATPRHIIG